MKSSLSVGLLLSLFCAAALAQDGDSPATRVTVSLQTGTTAPATAGKAARGSQAPVAMAASGQPLVAMTILAVETVQTPIPRQRRIDYSTDQIVIVGLAVDGSELTRTVMTDPRLVRAEAILGEADLAATRFYRPSVDFPLLLDDPDVVTVNILKPRWTGGEWQFDLIAAATLR